MTNRLDDALPAGYRWATDSEAENFTMWDNVPGAIHVRVGGTDDNPYTDIAVPNEV